MDAAGRTNGGCGQLRRVSGRLALESLAHGLAPFRFKWMSLDAFHEHFQELFAVATVDRTLHDSEF